MTVINLHHITKVEGHANVTIKVRENKVEKVQLEVVEGARLFEAIVKGRKHDEVAHFTSRICGICSVSHHLAATIAVENALGVLVSEQTQRLRELLNIGEMLQSHALHLFLLALPDYYGFSSAIEMSQKHKELVVMGLNMKKLGNEIMEVIGGRAIHPVTTTIGGFHKLPDRAMLHNLAEKMRSAISDAQKTAEIFASLDTEFFARRTEYFCISELRGYPNIAGSLISTEKVNCLQKEYQKYIQERVMGYSRSKFSVSKNRGFMVGALARVNNCREKLSATAQRAIRNAKIIFPNYNPFMNNFCQAVELIHYLEQGISIIKRLELKEESLPEFELPKKEARGVGIVEAPRGILIHDYTIDKHGEVIAANIITPTAMNLRNIEEDIEKFLPRLLKMRQEEIVLELEKLIRAYDPCISCSTHFLEVKWE
ncbi:MAG: Ni/Fe hydrogenase subunit alpha [Candidatus Woesearchaeota archaeon]